MCGATHTAGAAGRHGRRWLVTTQCIQLVGLPSPLRGHHKSRHIYSLFCGVRGGKHVAPRNRGRLDRLLEHDRAHPTCLHLDRLAALATTVRMTCLSVWLGVDSTRSPSRFVPSSRRRPWPPVVRIRAEPGTANCRVSSFLFVLLRQTPQPGMVRWCVCFLGVGWGARWHWRFSLRCGYLCRATTRHPPPPPPPDLTGAVCEGGGGGMGWVLVSSTDRAPLRPMCELPRRSNKKQSRHQSRCIASPRTRGVVQVQPPCPRVWRPTTLPSPAPPARQHESRTQALSPRGGGRTPTRAPVPPPPRQGEEGACGWGRWHTATLLQNPQRDHTTRTAPPRRARRRSAD